MLFMLTSPIIRLMNKRTKKALFLRLVVLSVILFVAAGSMFAAFLADHILRVRSAEQFETTANVFLDTVVDRMENHTDLLYSGRSYVVNTPGATQESWDRFFRDKEAFSRHKGISTIAYLETFDESGKAGYLQRMRSQPHFGGDSFAIKPEGTRDRYVVVNFASSDNDINQSFGFDLYASQNRRDALDQSVATGRPRATEPYKLATGYPGMSLFLPVYKHDALIGFALVSFRTDDLMKNLQSEADPQLRYKITDITDSNSPKPLYGSPNWSEDMPLKRRDTVNIAGRTWEITSAGMNSYGNSRLYQLIPFLILAVGILVSVPLFIAFFVFAKADDTTS